jgi:hypothetical protein
LLIKDMHWYMPWPEQKFINFRESHIPTRKGHCCLVLLFIKSGWKYTRTPTRWSMPLSWSIILYMLCCCCSFFAFSFYIIFMYSWDNQKSLLAFHSLPMFNYSCMCVSMCITVSFCRRHFIFSSLLLLLFLILYFRLM